MSKIFWAVQERTDATTWRTESTYTSDADARLACMALRLSEPTNDNGEPVEYRVVAVQS